jgi:hypothetical protein
MMLDEIDAVVCSASNGAKSTPIFHNSGANPANYFSREQNAVDELPCSLTRAAQVL